MKITPKKVEKLLRKFDMFNIHLRQMTSGVITERNVHFWEKGDWQFAHNGTIYNLAEDGKCDSLGLFQLLLSKNYLKDSGRVEYKKIQRYLTNTSFWGRFVIVNTKTQKVYYFGDFHTYLLHNQTLLISSTKILFRTKDDEINFNGLSFSKERKSKSVLSDEIEGIHILDLNKFRFKQITEELEPSELKETKPYGGYRSDGYNSPSCYGAVDVDDDNLTKANDKAIAEYNRSIARDAEEKKEKEIEDKVDGIPKDIRDKALEENKDITQTQWEDKIEKWAIKQNMKDIRKQNKKEMKNERRKNRQWKNSSKDWKSMDVANKFHFKRGKVVATPKRGRGFVR